MCERDKGLRHGAMAARVLRARNVTQAMRRRTAVTARGMERIRARGEVLSRWKQNGKRLIRLTCMVVEEELFWQKSS